MGLMVRSWPGSGYELEAEGMHSGNPGSALDFFLKRRHKNGPGPHELRGDGQDSSGIIVTGT